MAMMVKKVSEQTSGTRRSIILAGDVERAAREMRGDRGGGGAGGGGRGEGDGD